MTHADTPVGVLGRVTHRAAAPCGPAPGRHSPPLGCSPPPIPSRLGSGARQGWALQAPQGGPGEGGT